jgi:hypothetical protein
MLRVFPSRSISLLYRIGRVRQTSPTVIIVARALEALAWLNISLQMRHGWSWQAGWKLVGPEGDAS